MLTPIVDLFQGMSKILTFNFEQLDAFQGVLGVIGVLTLARIGYQKTLLAYAGLQKGYAIAQVALEYSKKAGILGTIGAMVVALGIQLGLLSASLATNAAVTFGVGVAIAVAAALAGYAMIKSQMNADDMVSPWWKW